jgi:hypothetical protein
MTMAPIAMPSTTSAIGDGLEHGDDPAWDGREAEALYEPLEREVVPEFYARNEEGIPSAWVAWMRQSMARLTLDPDAVRLELYADDAASHPTLECERRAAEPGGASVYRFRIPAARPATDYSVRLIPQHPGVAVPLEAEHILWQR